jgi:uncharacterized protein (DUF3084 family)
MQQGATSGLNRARQSLEMTERLVASATEHRAVVETKGIAELRGQFESERKALLLARDELEGKYREASEKARVLEQQSKDAAEAFAKERAEAAARDAEAERLRVAIEGRVQDLSQRFAAMAKERLLNSHKPAPPSGAPSPAAAAELETAKSELAKERKFLQRRAIEMLDREEKVRGREMALDGREAAVGKREQDLGAREAALSKVVSAPPAPAGSESEEARKDIERRVKIIQQKALELLDREEKLRKRAAELEALETRLSGNLPAR